MSTAAVSPPISIISPVKDFLFFFLSAAVVLVAWFASSVMKIDGYTILAAVAVASNGPHLVSTWTRVYFDPREWRSRVVSTVLVPILIFGAVLSFNLWLGDLGPRVLNSTILYWATWHFVAQNWGILRIYQRKSGEPLGTMAMKLERPILLLIVLFCLLHRLYTGPRVLFGVEVLYLKLPYAVVMAVLAPLVVLTGVLLFVRVKERHHPWSRAAWLRVAFIACSFLGFFVPFQLIKSDDTSAFAAAACWHGFQYLGMVRHYNRNVWKQGVDSRARIISWLSQPGWTRGFLYWVLLMALAGVTYGSAWVLAALTSGQLQLGVASAIDVPWLKLFTFLPAWGFFTWAGIVWVSATLSHYWIDGVIWKLRKSELAQRVGIADAQSATSASTEPSAVDQNASPSAA
ncbi:MAG: hypothetical protein U0228_01220 [Myxococcaceae bacterium]